LSVLAGKIGFSIKLECGSINSLQINGSGRILLCHETQRTVGKISDDWA
jgi:hypothetical protein